MSRLTEFKWWIFKDRRPLYVDDFGNVVPGSVDNWKRTDGQPASLQKSPTGWKDVLVKYARNSKYLGVFREYTPPLDFALDGARILRDQLWREGYESELQIGISRLDRKSWPAEYKPWYLGDIDLSKFKQNKDVFSCMVTEGGPIKYIKANENTAYEIDLDECSVYLDGFPFKNTAEFSVFSQLIGNLSGSNTYDIGMGEIEREGTSQGIALSDQQQQESVVSPGQQYFLKSFTKNTTVSISGVINFAIQGSIGLEMTIEKTASSGTTTQYTIVNGTYSNGDVRSEDFEFTISVIPGDTLGLRCTIDTAGGVRILDGSGLKFNYEVRFSPTVVPAITASTLFKRLCLKVTGDRYNGQSSFLDALENIVFTSGTGIRGMGDAKIKISFDDFYRTIKRWGVGVGIEGDRIVLEQYSYFFRSGTVLSIGPVDNLELSLAEDFIYNTVKVGYRNNTYDNVNGTDEFNVTQTYELPIKRVVKELDLISPTRADMYGVEITRLNLSGKDTTDNSADNDPFMLDVVQGGSYTYFEGTFTVDGTGVIVVPGTLASLTGQSFEISGGGSVDGTYTVTNTSYVVDGFTKLTVTSPPASGIYNAVMTASSATLYQLNRPAYSPLTGLIQPNDAFNISLSPKRGLLNNGALFHAALEYDGALIKFASGEKNSELVAGSVVEKSDVNVGSLDAPLFLPYFIEFDAAVPDDFLQVMEATPYGEVELEYKGAKIYGYLWDGGVKPVTNEKAKFKLLMSARTNKQDLNWPG